MEYHTVKSPMENLLSANSLSDSEKLTIHEFARKNGISEGESLWNQLLLQISVIEKYAILLKETEKNQEKHVSDILAAMDFVLKKILNTASQKTDVSLEVIQRETEHQIKIFKANTESYIQQIVEECGNRVEEALNGSITSSFDALSQRLNEIISQIEKESTALKQAGHEARKDIKINLLEIGVYCGIGSLIGAVTFYVMVKLLG